INAAHPFGLRLWKPALYTKTRTIDAIAEDAIHAAPGPSLLTVSNVLWVFVFGAPLALLHLAVALLLAPFAIIGGACRGRGGCGALLPKLAMFLLWPFGSFVEFLPPPAPFPSDTTPLLSDDELPCTSPPPPLSPTLGSTPSLSTGRSPLLIRLIILATLAPVQLAVSGICFWLIATIPMAKLTYTLLKHLLRHPQQLSVGRPSARARGKIILCTHYAAGSEFFRFTVDGINVCFVSLLLFVVVTFADYFIVGHAPSVFQTLGALLSVVPLSYLIGMAVASISSETGVGVGCAINATFGSAIEILLYIFAILEGKQKVVQGAMIGSLLAGLLALPGVSMFTSGLKWKEIAINHKSAGVSSTMLLFATIATFTPTVFHTIYGGEQMRCAGECEAGEAACTCRMAALPIAEDPTYARATLPLSQVCAASLVLVYALGLWFTLRTHARRIYGGVRDDASSIASHEDDTADVGGDGHGAPTWSLAKSGLVLLVCTVAYSGIAEILVSCVDLILSSVHMSERVLGITLFAVMPCVVEFYNAIAFARSGNIALSLELGSAYALQATMLQIPAIVLFSAVAGPRGSFALVFPLMDVYATLTAVLLLSYTCVEGKATYLRGGILLALYGVFVSVYLFEP
ncbi:hypothetical protein BDK51DRAFT_22651, partial [Blyttiomyces helicus]